MAVTVTSQLTTLSSCEVTTGWTIHNRAGTAGALGAVQASDEEAPPREGTYCLGFDLDIESGGYYYTITSADYSSKMLYIWIFSFTAANLDTKLNGGIWVMARDTSGNFGYWYVGGSDTYAGGWRCVVADFSRAPDANNGTAPNMALCDGVGIGFKSLAKSKLARNMFFDFMREADSGDGLLVETTAASVATWEDVFSGDNTGAIGVIRKEGGVYFVQGPVTFGDTAGGDCEFLDTGQLIVFEDSDVPTGHYAIVVEGATGTLEYQMGTAAGARGVSGCVFKTAAATTEAYVLTMTDTDVDNLYLYGCSFIGAGQTNLPTTSVTKKIISCNFEEAGPVVISTCTVTFCNFIASPGSAVEMSSTSHAMTFCNFINCTTGVEITAVGTYSFNNLQFTDCTYDVENSVSGTLVDSYTTQNSTVLLNGTNNGVSQTFDGNTGVLSNARFYLSSSGSPTGNVYARLYAVSGGLPTGAALAESDPVAAADISGTPGYVQFQFTDEYTLSSGTNNFAIACEYADGDGTNYIAAGTDTGNGDGGTGGVYTTSWASGDDVPFYVTSGAIVTINATDSNPGKILNSGTNPGAVIINNTVTLTITAKDVDNNTLEGIRVRIERTSDGSLISQGTTNVSGVYTDGSYNYTGDVGVTVKARRKGYKNFRTTATIDSGGLNLTVTLQKDRIVDLP